MTPERWQEVKHVLATALELARRGTGRLSRPKLRRKRIPA